MTGAIIAFLSLLAGVVAAFFAGKSSGKTKQAQSRADTLERAIHADTGNPDGSGDLEWMQRRSK